MFVQNKPLQSEATNQASRADWIILGVLFCAYVPFVFLGYGTDNDAYGVLDAGKILWNTHKYVPSRNPGYLLFELVMLGLNALGGSILCNLASVTVSLTAIGLFQFLCRHFHVPHRPILSLIFGLIPTWWLNATAVSDHAWGVMWVLLALVLFIKERPLWAGLVLGLALGTRLASFVGVGAVGVFALLTQPAQRSRIVIAGVIGLVIGLSCFIPPWFWAKAKYGDPWRFLEAQVEGASQWTLAMRFGRFAYRNLYFWGLPAALLLAGFIGFGIPSLVNALRRAVHRPIVLLCVAAVVGYELLFLKYPIEKGYLIAMVPWLLILVGLATTRSARPLYLFLVAVLFHSVVTINFTQPDSPGSAKKAVTGVWMEPGDLLTDLDFRYRFKDCKTLDEWNARYRDYGAEVRAGKRRPWIR